ncbi:MAG TPA: VOC family protein [bacterium]|jgi:predicted 3-demethylubiquinone-9 3-methyltransferase (glyoxalase superfamily)
MQKITTFLWFDNQAEEAAKLYVSLFKNSKILNITRHEGAGPDGTETVAVVDFQLDGQLFMAMNAKGPFKFTEAISFMVNCETQEEVDRLWEKLTEGGEESMCGWLKDRFGLSWQITPIILNKMMADPNRKKANAVMQAMLGMQKIDIAALKRAYDQG